MVERRGDYKHLEEMNKAMQQHFIDDDRRFTNIESKLDIIDERQIADMHEAQEFRKVVREHIEKSNTESRLIQPLVQRVVELSSIGDSVNTANHIREFLKWGSGFSFIGVVFWFFYQLIK